MNVTKPIIANAQLPGNPLDRINLTPFERLCAEGAIRHGEDIAELILSVVNTVRSLFGRVKIKQQAPASHRLGPTG